LKNVTPMQLKKERRFFCMVANFFPKRPKFQRVGNIGAEQ
jgi:hypothetical protein